MLERFAETLSALSFCSPVSISNDVSIESRGGAILTISDKCDALLYLEGLIDTAKEKTRVTSRIETTQQQLAKLRTTMSMANYAEKVPASIREANQEKEAQLEAELLQLDTAMATLSTLG